MMSHLAPFAVDMPINTVVKLLLLSVDRSPLRSTMDVKRSLIHSTDPTKDCLLTLIYGAHLMIFHQVSVCLVLAEDLFDEDDYIRNYKDFIDYLKQK